jgi:hypothetical protein
LFTRSLCSLHVANITLTLNYFKLIIPKIAFE